MKETVVPTPFLEPIISAADIQLLRPSLQAAANDPSHRKRTRPCTKRAEPRAVRPDGFEICDERTQFAGLAASFPALACLLPPYLSQRCTNPVAMKMVE